MGWRPLRDAPTSVTPSHSRSLLLPLAALEGRTLPALLQDPDAVAMPVPDIAVLAVVLPDSELLAGRRIAATVLKPVAATGSAARVW